MLSEGKECEWQSVQCKRAFFGGGKDGGCFVRGSVGVEEALVRGVREKSPDAAQTLGFKEALDGKTGAGQGTWKEEKIHNEKYFISLQSGPVSHSDCG